MSAPPPQAGPPAPRELQIQALLDTLPAGARVLDAGCGPGTFVHADYPALRTTAIDLLVAPALAGHFARSSAERLPFPDAAFDVILAHWLLEHVDDLTSTLDELRRVLRPGGLLAVAVPNSHSFEDRLYRFVSQVYKFVLLHPHKRIEHVQILTFLSLNLELYRRGFKLLRCREEEAGYCWLDIPQLRLFRTPCLATLRLARRLGIDLFAGANYRLLYRLGGGADAEGRYLAAQRAG